MDKNLAPGTHYYGSMHETEETHNFQNDLCHNILTGKVLPPAPIEVAEGRQLALKVHTDMHTEGEGFEFVYDLRGNDWYIASVTCGITCAKVLLLGTENNRAGEKIKGMLYVSVKAVHGGGSFTLIIYQVCMCICYPA